MRARRARPSDVSALHGLIAFYAEQGILLPRTEQNLREHLRYFLVLAENQRVVGCVALEKYSDSLAEIRSLAIDPAVRGCGMGTRLVKYALKTATRQNIARVFAVTHAPQFFIRQGFEMSSREALAEKVERDCSSCPKAQTCQLFAVIATLLPERINLPVIDSFPVPSAVA
jgi:N-acetylglutamate synthase-like GNAT family acetyltransferase